MSKHTEGPWTVRRALAPTDGEFDYAISAKIGNREYCISEAFGRVAEKVTAPAEANAARIVFAINALEPDGLVTKALRAIAQIQRDKCERADAETLFMLKMLFVLMLL